MKAVLVYADRHIEEIEIAHPRETWTEIRSTRHHPGALPMTGDSPTLRVVEFRRQSTRAEIVDDGFVVYEEMGR